MHISAGGQLDCLQLGACMSHTAEVPDFFLCPESPVLSCLVILTGNLISLPRPLSLPPSCSPRCWQLPLHPAPHRGSGPLLTLPVAQDHMSPTLDPHSFMHAGLHLCMHWRLLWTGLWCCRGVDSLEEESNALQANEDICPGGKHSAEQPAPQLDPHLM